MSCTAAAQQRHGSTAWQQHHGSTAWQQHHGSTAWQQRRDSTAGQPLQRCATAARAPAWRRRRDRTASQQSRVSCNSVTPGSRQNRVATASQPRSSGEARGAPPTLVLVRPVPAAGVESAAVGTRSLASRRGTPRGTGGLTSRPWWSGGGEWRVAAHAPRGDQPLSSSAFELHPKPDALCSCARDTCETSLAAVSDTGAAASSLRGAAAPGAHVPCAVWRVRDAGGAGGGPWAVRRHWTGLVPDEGQDAPVRCASGALFASRARPAHGWLCTVQYPHRGAVTTCAHVCPGTGGDVPGRARGGAQPVGHAGGIGGIGGIGAT